MLNQFPNVGGYVKKILHNFPNKMSKGTVEKGMIDRFIRITINIFLRTIRIMLRELIFSGNYIKILIFSGICSFQIYFRRNTIRTFIISAYIDLTEKEPEVFSFQTKTSEVSLKLTIISSCTRCNQVSTNFMLKLF
jgi:hypothetical protein